ncbi:class I SAM-dependent methyltransferase [Rheinheimera sp.]|uniref:class I SAM-dependent methyltransferase n=1 Tax=Rheinheimera sp. TaxID=1869214 RepID=UPI002FDE9ECA
MLKIRNKVRSSVKYFSLVACCAAFHLTAANTETVPVSALQQVVDSDYRSADNKHRDQYRHPVETLTFFGIRPEMSVLEVWPARGWYTEILAPYLKDKGQLTIANFRQNDGTLEDERKIFWAKLAKKLEQDIDEHPEHFGKVKSAEFDPPGLMQPGQVNQYDMVLSFRNSHIWNEEGYLLDVYRALFDVLKPGGTLGIVEHRSSRLSEISSRAGEGYLDEYYVIAVAQQAGFVLVDRSEINANPKDSKDYPKGVYALPPTLAMGALDKNKYLAIGESDRMTLKFTKPLQ